MRKHVCPYVSVGIEGNLITLANSFLLSIVKLSSEQNTDTSKNQFTSLSGKKEVSYLLTYKTQGTKNPDFEPPFAMRTYPNTANPLWKQIHSENQRFRCCIDKSCSQAKP